MGDDDDDDASERLLHIHLEDDDVEEANKPANTGDADENKENIPPQNTANNDDNKSCASFVPILSNTTPLLDYLCSYNNCSLKELQVLFQCLPARRRIIDHLRKNVVLHTTHLRPPGHNFIVRCNDLTTQASSIVPALGGYLNVTVSSLKKIIKINPYFQVRAYYYVKHGYKIRHPYLPCIIMYGGGKHRAFYPLEVLTATPKNA